VKPGQLERNVLLLVTIGLVAFGLVMVYSATSASATIGGGQPMYYLKRQGTYALIGLVCLFLGSRVDFRVWKRIAPTLLVGAVVLLVGVLALGQSANGARRWIALGPAAIQPSELAKVALAAWAAMLLSRRSAPRSFEQLAKPLGIVTLLLCALVVVEPDLGTAIALSTMVIGMLLIAGSPLRLIGGTAALALTLGLAAIWFEPYRRTRIFSFIDPWHDAQGAGFQTVQAMIGLGSGGFFGVGLGQGVQKVFYLPEAHTDMIYAIIGEELGLVGSTAVVAAFAAFAWAGLRIALISRDPFGKALAAGLTLLVCGQAAINLAAVVGIAPLTGVPLPFVSYGGSSLVVVLGAVGVLLNIGRNAAVAPLRAVVPDRSRRDSRPHRPVARDRRSAAGSRGQRQLRRYA
jgi:cell division protein FtsW